MFLTEEQLVLAVHGWVDKEILDGHTYFYRFTKKQREYYASTRYRAKEQASSGMYMEFITDASAIKFKTRQQPGSSQKMYGFDLYINGTMRDSFRGERLEESVDATVEFALPSGEKAVRIYLPNLTATGLKEVELKEATIFIPTEKAVKYIAYGDSITQGYTATNPSLSYVNRVGREFDAEVYDLGVGGEFFDPRMQDEDYPIKADLVTVAYGTNDWSGILPGEDNERRKKFFEGLVKIHEGAKIFYILPIWRGDAEKEKNGYGKLDDYCAMVREEMKHYPEITVVEGDALVPHHVDFFKPDQLHPNDLGFCLYGENLLKEIKKYR